MTAGRGSGARLAAALLALVAAWPAAADAPPPPASGTLRIAQFNAALSRPGAGVLLADIEERAPQVLAVAEIVLRTRPDILVLQEFDRDAEGRALAAFRALLAEGVAGLPGLDLPHAHQGPVNTGIPSGLDIDGDGTLHGPDDAWGWGAFPGQFGMAVLSRHPIAAGDIRTYRLFPWAALPGADRPMRPDGTPFHPDEVWQALRLSSKTHWDVPVDLPAGRLHILATHPTPPVFDGPEDRNGRRNSDELRLLAAMIDGPPWLADDTGRPAGLAPGTPFVVAGDLNADPFDGDARREGLEALLSHPRLRDPAPESPGATAAATADGGANAVHGGPPARDTADWRDTPGPGNLRVDYLLPSAGLQVLGTGVFWPAPGDPLARLTSGGRTPASSDHRLIWLDLAVAPD